MMFCLCFSWYSIDIVSLYVRSLYPVASLIWQFLAYLSRFIVVLSLNCLCANLAYGLQELNKIYLLTMYAL